MSGPGDLAIQDVGTKVGWSLPFTPLRILPTHMNYTCLEKKKKKSEKEEQ